MSLSDLFCVERHKAQFLDLVKNKLDIVFANEQEMLSLINTKKFDDVINFSKRINKNIVITRGEKGARARKGEEIIERKAEEKKRKTDMTGTGDCTGD